MESLTKRGPLEKGTANRYGILAPITHEQYERQKDRTPEDELPKSVASENLLYNMLLSSVLCHDLEGGWEWVGRRSKMGAICLPGGSDSKESACSAGDLGSILGLGRSPGEGNGCLFQYS